MRGVGSGFDFASAANTRIRTPGLAELFQCRRVRFPAPALVKRFAIPVETQPTEIGDGLFDVTRFHSCGIEVIYPQQHAPARRASGQPRDEERAGVAEMQPAAGSWSQATNNHVRDFPLCR
jgi:hypothetical protein